MDGRYTMCAVAYLHCLSWYSCQSTAWCCSTLLVVCSAEPVCKGVADFEGFRAGMLVTLVLVDYSPQGLCRTNKQHSCTSMAHTQHVSNTAVIVRPCTTAYCRCICSSASCNSQLHHFQELQTCLEQPGWARSTLQAPQSFEYHRQATGSTMQ